MTASRKNPFIGLLLVIFLLWHLLGGGGRLSHGAPDSCSRKRQVFNATWGIISDGEGEYPQDSHCEWLVAAGRKGQVINLKFNDMLTECAYDYLFIYDGDSYGSTLLGSFSGSTRPLPIYAKSGNMLLLLFSDTNYVQKGFEAEFSITDCIFNCSYNGRCDNNICICDDMWMGPSCAIRRCPDDCGQAAGRGSCRRLPAPARCVCNDGYSGQSCSLSVNDSAGNQWHLLAATGTGLTPRTGHTAAYLSLCDCLFVFGGFTLNEYLGDLAMYNFSTSEWKTLVPKSGRTPPPCYGHAMVAYGDSLWMYGGKLKSSRFSNDLWRYEIYKNAWTKLRIRGPQKPPPLARHSLTLVDDYYLYLFGGNYEHGEFSSEMHRINLKEEPLFWERVYTLGGKEMERRLVGHSTVYHPESRSLIVYGGIAVDVAKFSKLSDKIHIFNIETRYWSFVNYSKHDSDLHVPMERAFHSANIVGNYMIVYGGYTHLHSKEEICFDQKMYFYHLGCHVWINIKGFGKDFIGNDNPSGQGSFSHVGEVRNGNTLLMVAGYSGAVRGDLLAYTVPASISTQESIKMNMTRLCQRHTSRESCKANPECGWCPGAIERDVENDTCMDRTHNQYCKLGLDTQECPGICPLLLDCQACLAIGSGLKQASLKSDPRSNAWKPCVWCVQKAECFPQGSGVGICSQGNVSSMDVIGWWGYNATRILSLDECRFKDFRPGLTLLKYRHPPNWNQPDEVSIINSTTENFSFMPEFPGHREQEAEGEYIARFRGFIHPLGTKPKADKHLRLFIGTSHVQAVLRMSTNESEQFLEVVANHTSQGDPLRTEANRPDDKSIFPDPSRGHKYLIDFDVRLAINPDASYGDHATIQLVWNGFPSFRKEFTFEFLEPFNRGPCSTYNNCLACIADAACGWCGLLSACLDRISESSKSAICRNNQHSQYLVTQSRDCVLCSNYIYCENCTAELHCEWLVKDSHCVRRGRFLDSVQDVASCPVPCNLRHNCTSCLGDPGRCAWCEHTQECFLFSTYTSTYLYGMCREWVDEDHIIGQGLPLIGAQCRNCSLHSNCSECITDLRCGWCGNVENPRIGECIEGDFQGKCPISQQLRSSDFQWSYSFCPDVEECLLGLHSCHPNATCTNTFKSYTCTCNKGFQGDGHKVCEKTCDEKCVHGVCSEDPLYKCVCELGWAGSDCSVNCGCNNHSTCAKGPGDCDRCQNWTEGPHCERCKPGSYGNATTVQGCQKCDCNSHGNMSAGYCDMRTRVCYCEDHTEGEHCERCQAGYYGDSRNGGSCFLHCGSRQVLTSITKGGLGSGNRGSAMKSCLWILTVHPELQENLFLRDSATPSIELTIHAGMNIHCVRNYLYIYDGLPSFVSKDPHWDWQNKVLGAFCGARLNHSIVVEAKSGYLTVFYERGDPSQGFNSTYQVNFCSGGCPINRTCVQGWCQCSKGRAGVDCELVACPNNCSQAQRQGRCIQEFNVCVCESGFAGDDCSRKLEFHEISQSVLVNLHLLAPNVEHLASKLPRFGHSLVVDSAGNLWLYGGYSLSLGPLGDMYKFDTFLHKLEEVTILSQGETNRTPSNRYFHAAAFVKRKFGEMYILGGLAKKRILGDFWKFYLNSKEWKALKGPPQLTAVAGHSLTSLQDRALLLIGGFDIYSGFSEKMYEYDLSEDQWKVLNTSGFFPLGIYGHTAVFHPATMSVYVFGGIIYKLDKLVMSNELYALDYRTKRWTVLPAERGPFHLANERFRYLHTAVSMDDYMVVLGGRSTNDNLTKSILVYSYSCNTWLDLASEGKTTVGKSYRPAIAQSAVRHGNSVYIFGGFSGKLLGNLVKMDLPEDLCTLLLLKQDCWQAPGCRFCSVYQSNQVNQSYCHSINKTSPESCNLSNGTVALSSISQHCSKELIENRNCEQYLSCAECLAVWPSYPSAKNVCQWCTTCQGSRCIPVNATCEEESNCNYLKQVVHDANNCIDNPCAASDCEKCLHLKSCIWTRQIFRSRDMGRTMSTVSIKPIYDWNCFSKKIQKASSFPPVSVPPMPCPPRCSQHKDCRICLESAGAEGGWHECQWSEALKQCISPSYQPLLCVGGVCEQVLRGSPEQCPRNCSAFDQCARCLAHPHCGWYAVTGPQKNGQGICLKGGLHGPEKDDPVGTALKDTVQNCQDGVACIDSNITKWVNMAPMEWAYLKCPPENECLNNHHTCNQKSEECVDTSESFKCHCRAGYVKEGKSLCKPVCNQGCEHGNCVAPDSCKCYFGYVGNNCSTQCHCNGHSNCAGIDQLDSCLKCTNYTQGKQCDRCQPSYVGDPRNGGECISCNKYCNGHAKVCVELEHYNITLQLLSSENDFVNVTDRLEFLQEGPTAGALCILCQNNTHRDRCEECLPGFFRTTDNPEESCRPCECHGHGNSCDPVTGDKCNCQNNTETEQCTQKGKNNQPCWKLQCSKCKESFLGNPTNGHHCYKQMFVDRDYCFDRSVQDSCLTPNPLMWGRTVFFVVHPKYMNVDIRVIVDVAQGGVDLYFSPKEDTFVVDTDRLNGVHSVSFDVKYNIDHLFENQSSRRKRSSKDFHHSSEELTLEATLNGTDKSPHYRVLERTAAGLNTFVTVTDPFEFFVIRNIQNRLVITLPQEVHDLRSTRFYMVLQGVGSVASNVTFGSLFFRQDQPRIDLFVFFSVFFSCFFLFLAVCVVVWKIKQAVDVRRVRQRQVAEMEHMASRPFARILAIIDDEDRHHHHHHHHQSEGVDFAPYSPMLHGKKSKAGKHSHSVARESPKIQNDDRFFVRPVAVEPTYDGNATVGTLLVQLPGGSSAPVKLALGSSLITMRYYSNTYSSIKACMRRRTSYHNT